MLTHADVCCMLTYADVCRASEEEGLLAQPAATAASVQRGSHGPPEKGSHAPPPPEAGVLSPPEGGSHGPPADRGCLSAFALRAARLGCRCMLTYAHVCSRMLTYAHVCSRMLTYARLGCSIVTCATVEAECLHVCMRQWGRVDVESEEEERMHELIHRLLLPLD